MKIFSKVKTSNGFIKSTGNAMDDDDLSIYNADGYIAIVHEVEFDPNLYRYNFTTDTFERKTFIPYTLDKTIIHADGQDTATITDLPDELSIRWDDYTRAELPDGEPIEFCAAYPGTYVLLLKSPIHLPTEVIIEAIS